MDKKTTQTATLKKVLRYMKKYIPLLIFSIILATVTVAMTLYFPILIGNALDLIIETGKVDFVGISEIIQKALMVIAAGAAAQWVMNICNNRMTYHIVMDIRKDAFRKIEKLPLSYIDSKSHGDIVSRVIADVDTFAEGLLMGFTQLFSGLATIAGTLLFMLSLDVKITLVVVVITPISLFVASFIATRTYSMFQLQSKTKGEQTALIDEIIGNQKIVQAFSHENETQAEFEEINNRLQKYALNATFFSSLVNPSTRFVNSLVYAAVGIFGALSAIAGGISVGQLSCFLTYANQYTKPFNEISGVVTELQNALACAARIFELIEETAEREDAADAYELKQADGRVSIEHVNFSYDPEQKLIEDLNLQVNPGQRVAIVGPTGCGKTTFINLLMRFYDVDSGSISLGEAVGANGMNYEKCVVSKELVRNEESSIRRDVGCEKDGDGERALNYENDAVCDGLSQNEFDVMGLFQSTQSKETGKKGWFSKEKSKMFSNKTEIQAASISAGKESQKEEKPDGVFSVSGRGDCDCHQGEDRNPDIGECKDASIQENNEMHDILSMTRKSLRQNYGMVLQETWLKAGTIRENICMGKPDATEEEMIAAAKASHAHGFIKRLPNGYDTLITEDGGNLSQGQKQLLCIARVMLCLPPMLILDEATSSIDTRTEMKIQKAFLTMMKGRTSFIVAHRLSTIRESDIILVMKEGKIIEQGTHEELLAKDGFYKMLYHSQF